MLWTHLGRRRSSNNLFRRRRRKVGTDDSLKGLDLVEHRTEEEGCAGPPNTTQQDDNIGWSVTFAIHGGGCGGGGGGGRCIDTAPLEDRQW